MHKAFTLQRADGEIQRFIASVQRRGKEQSGDYGEDEQCFFHERGGAGSQLEW